MTPSGHEEWVRGAISAPGQGYRKVARPPPPINQPPESRFAGFSQAPIPTALTRKRSATVRLCLQVPKKAVMQA
jgi:hypothetical protein